MRKLLFIATLCALGAPMFAQTFIPSPSDPLAVIDTTAGKLRCTIFQKETPNAANNFIGLAEGTKDWKSPVTHQSKLGTPLYNGTIFHRVIPRFMIQGGDPMGNGMGDAGYNLTNGEILPNLKFDVPGRLAYANAGNPNTSSSQFFITEVPTPFLNGNYIIFGQCDQASVDLVKKIARMARDSRDRPYDPVKINSITIEKPKAAK
jgi:peptidyl-prolyl cis-trans isomerase A (cyclophilin A)